MHALSATTRQHFGGCSWFWVWALLGSALTLGALSFGPVLTLPVLMLAGFMLSRPAVRESAFGLVTGVGALVLSLTWIGPPKSLAWPLVGAVLIVAGIAGHASQRD